MRLAGLGVLAAGMPHASWTAGEPEAKGVPGNAARPNILFILADDLGIWDVGFTGVLGIQKTTNDVSRMTPNLDQLAKSGAVFESFYVMPVCSPTRACLMTGRYAARTGVYGAIPDPGSKWGLPLEERTLAQALKEAGYETAISGKWHLGAFEPAYLPTQRGFDHQYGLHGGSVGYYTLTDSGKPDEPLEWWRDDKPCDAKGYCTYLLADEMCRVIRESKPGKPLFLYLPFNAPHMVYLPPPEKLPGSRDGYSQVIGAIDKAVGQVVAALKEKGLLDNTLIVFSTDNGGASSQIKVKGRPQSPFRGHKSLVYEGGVRSCAFACWPGKIPAGTIIKEPVHMIDWYPTLVKLAGGSLDQKLPLDGKDIWPVITQGAKSPHDALLLDFGGTRAIRMGDWKLLKPVNAQKKPLESGEEFELYNLATDIGEEKNLAKENPKKVQELNAKLEALVKDEVKPAEYTIGLKRAEAKRQDEKKKGM